MIRKIGMPNLGHTMEAGTLVQWLKREGERVGQGDPLAEVESDKAVFVIESPAAGVLLRVDVAEGTTVAVGHVLGYVGDPGDHVPEDGPAFAARAQTAAPPAPTMDSGRDPAQPPAPSVRARVSPLARRLARDHGLDAEQLTGTGPQGSVTQDDVRQALAARPGPGLTARPHGPSVAERRPLRAMRRTIAQRMTASWQQAPQVTHMLEADMSAASAFRREHGVSVTDLVLAAVARALVAFPDLNAAWGDDHIDVYAEVNIGLAVALPDGLVTPVVRQAAQLPLAELSRQRRHLVEKAVAGQLMPDDLAGGTFTLTNLGQEGIRFFTPILNPPQAGILGMGRVVDAPVGVAGRVELRPLMGLCLTFDHRVVDGLPAARFLAHIKGLLEAPAGLARLLQPAAASEEDDRP